jgi:hypothetical protein
MKRSFDTNRPAAYAVLIPVITRTAREFGYAVAIHGSMTSDLDIVLVPWVEDAREPEDVVEAIRLLIGGKKRVYDKPPEKKPLGRLAWSFYFTDEDAAAYSTDGPYIDISVTPRGVHPPDLQAQWIIRKIFRNNP